MSANLRSIPDTEPRQRLPRPHSIEAEQAVLGGLMLSSTAWAQVADRLTEEDFYRRDHRLIFRAIGNLAEKGEPCDAITLGEWFEAQGLAEQMGGIGYVIELASTTPSAANVAAYADIVREKATLRHLIDVASTLARDAAKPEGAASSDIAARAFQSLLELGGRQAPRAARTLRQVAPTWLDDLARRYESQGGLVGHSTPWSKLDAVTLGLAAGELIVVAARPGMGKSALAVNLATHLALTGRRTLLFSLEMTAEAIFSRAVSALGEVPLKFLRAPNAQPGTDEWWSASTAAASRLTESPLTIDDSPGLTADGIVARVKREHLRQPINGAILIDHLHLLRLKGDNVAREIGAVTAAFKGLAKELGVPVIVLSQLNRSVEARANKRPAISDLRESGSIEQDADQIWFLYRDDYYAQQEGRSSNSQGLVELIVAKNREGEAGLTVWLQNALAYGRLDPFDGSPPTQPATKPRASGFLGAGTGGIPRFGKSAAAHRVGSDES